eukprot:896263-Prymnesium_polylepis.1
MPSARAPGHLLHHGAHRRRRERLEGVPDAGPQRRHRVDDRFLLGHRRLGGQADGQGVLQPRLARPRRQQLRRHPHRDVTGGVQGGEAQPTEPSRPRHGERAAAHKRLQADRRRPRGRRLRQ